jgi:hypothetical protein
MKYLKVKDNANLVRELKSNAIVNTDNEEYQNYLKQREMKSKNDVKINDLEKTVIDLKNDIEEIKTLLRNLKNGS